jgi:uncharacterized phage protein (TIGR01671 family)
MISFRGKRLDNGEWGYGDLVRSRLNGEHFYIKPTANCFEVNAAGLTKLVVMREIDADTIGQFTGMYDKNNNRIFEGDIVILFDEKCVVKTSEMRASFGLYKISNNMFYEMIHKNDQKWLEVIGNIYDNKDLLDEVDE